LIARQTCAIIKEKDLTKGGSNMPMSRRVFVATSALTLSLLPWVGSGSLTQEIKRGGHLNAIVTLETASLDPVFGNAPGSDRNFYNLFAENLVFQNSRGEIEPMLATSWEWGGDGKSITFKLRDGVKFQDGTPFDAEAVKFNFDRVIDPAVKARAAQYVVDLASTEVIDPLTVRVNLKQPSGAFLSILANEAGSIISPTAVRTMGADFARKPVGTGPFVITSWTSGKVDAERFKDYWRKAPDGNPLPYLDKVTVRVNSNTSVKIVELKGGSAQLGDAIQVKDFEQVENDRNVVLLDNIQGITQYITFNNQKPPFGPNIELRKAITHAINRQAVERAVSRGTGVVQTAFEPPNSWAWSKELGGHTFDVALAKEAYAKSGHKGPLTMIVVQRDPDVQIAQILQSMLKGAGIDLKIEVLERTAFVEKALSYNYELALLRNLGPLPDPDMTFASFFGRNAAQDFAGIKNPEIWDLVDKARGQIDREARKKDYIKIQQTILDNYWQAYLFWRPTKDIARKELQGFEREFNGGWRYEVMSLAN
jgi:peptide/nickel transport system substrate-binding protein